MTDRLITPLEQAGEGSREPFMPTVSLNPDALVKVAGGEVVTWAECQRRLAASTPVGGWEEPVAWVSPKQFANLIEIEPEDGGQYLPIRKSRAGLFTQPLYAAPPPPSVSIDSRPQEAVPTEGPDGSVLADLEKAWEILAAIPAINDLGSQYQEDIQAAILTALRATPQPADGCSSNEGAGGWIEWNGGENPVPGRRVDYKIRKPMIRPVYFNKPADGLEWDHNGDTGDIIAYRILPQTEKGS